MKTQKEIKDLISEKMEISKTDATKFMKIYSEIITDELINSGAFKIPNIGTLKVRYRPSRAGVKPKTREVIEISESLSAGLTASDTLKTTLNNKIDISIYRK